MVRDRPGKEIFGRLLEPSLAISKWAGKVSESRQLSAVEKDCDEMTEMKLANCQGRHL